jgi:hypothetical protein
MRSARSELGTDSSAISTAAVDRLEDRPAIGELAHDVDVALDATAAGERLRNLVDARDVERRRRRSGGVVDCQHVDRVTGDVEGHDGGVHRLMASDSEVLRPQLRADAVGRIRPGHERRQDGVLGIHVVVLHGVSSRSSTL